MKDCVLNRDWGPFYRAVASRIQSLLMPISIGMFCTLESHLQIICPAYPHWRENLGLCLHSDSKSLSGLVIQSGWSESWN